MSPTELLKRSAFGFAAKAKGAFDDQIAQMERRTEERRIEQQRVAEQQQAEHERQAQAKRREDELLEQHLERQREANLPAVVATANFDAEGDSLDALGRIAEWLIENEVPELVVQGPARVIAVTDRRILGIRSQSARRRGETPTGDEFALTDLASMRLQKRPLGSALEFTLKTRQKAILEEIGLPPAVDALVDHLRSQHSVPQTAPFWRSYKGESRRRRRTRRATFGASGSALVALIVLSVLTTAPAPRPRRQSSV